jgi:hypothetical protein
MGVHPHPPRLPRIDLNSCPDYGTPSGVRPVLVPGSVFKTSPHVHACLTLAESGSQRSTARAIRRRRESGRVGEMMGKGGSSPPRA